MKFRKSQNDLLIDYVIRLLKIYPGIRFSIPQPGELIISFGTETNGKLVYADRERHPMLVSRQVLLDEFYHEIVTRNLQIDIKEVCGTQDIDFVKKTWNHSCQKIGSYNVGAENTIYIYFSTLKYKKQMVKKMR